MNLPDEADRKAFLDLFPERERSLVANLFLAEVRAGIRNAEDIVHNVRVETSRRIIGAQRWEQPTEKYHRIQSALLDQSELAQHYAAYCIAYEALPGDEREKVRASHRAEGMQAVRNAMPASDAQKKYLLEGFGYRGDVEALSRQQASELISGFKAKQEQDRDRRAWVNDVNKGADFRPRL